MPLFCEGSIPEVLGVGGEKASAASPWWLFHRLSQLVRRAPAERVAPVRARWAQLQGEFFASAYEMAQAGRNLLDEGRAGAAERQLTAYMRNNAAAVLQAVGTMIESFQEVPEGVPAT